LAQFMHSQKCSILFADVGNPKKRPPSIRMRSLEQPGFAHFEIISFFGTRVITRDGSMLRSPERAAYQ